MFNQLEFGRSNTTITQRPEQPDYDYSHQHQKANTHTTHTGAHLLLDVVHTH